MFTVPLLPGIYMFISGNTQSVTQLHNAYFNMGKHRKLTSPTPRQLDSSVVTKTSIHWAKPSIVNKIVQHYNTGDFNEGKLKHTQNRLQLRYKACTFEDVQQ